MIKLNIKKLIDAFLLINIIINSGSAISVVNINFSFYLSIISFLILGYRYVKCTKVITIHMLEFNVLIIIIAIVFSSILNFNVMYITSYIKYFILIISAFFVIKLFDLKYIIHIFIKTMICIACISLVFFTISLMSPSIIEAFPQVININGVGYYTIGIYNTATYSITRNMGIFWEPSLFASFLCLAMLFEIHYKQSEMSFKRIIILGIALLTSQSTGGYLCFLIIILTFLLKSKVKVFENTKSILILFICILIILNWDSIINTLYTFNPRVFSKLIEKDDNISYSARMDCPEINLMLFQTSFIFGNGIGTTGELFQQVTKGLVSQTSTTTYAIATLGLLGFVFPLSIICSTIKQKNKSLTLKFLIIFVVFFILNKESHFSFYATYILMFALLNDKNEFNLSKDGKRKGYN